MKTWNTPVVDELNISETAGLGGLFDIEATKKEWEEHLKIDGKVSNWDAVKATAFYGFENFIKSDIDGDGVIGRPSESTDESTDNFS